MSSMSLTQTEARRFMLIHQGLYGEPAYAGMKGVLAYIRRVGCIQYDPLQVAGTNPELVLQSRVEPFDRSMLRDLLYKDRALVDYWDKQMAIVPVEDWPRLRRHRMRYGAWCRDNPDIVGKVRRAIADRGPLSSSDLDDDEKVNWAWGPTRLSRAALEGAFHAGRLVIHHRKGTRKYYDLAERHIPAGLYEAEDPNPTEESFHDWYVHRRIGSIGLLWNRPSDAWLGIEGLKSAERNAAFRRLLDDGRIAEVAVDGVAWPLYMRSEDRPIAERLSGDDPSAGRVRVLAPLDNVLWDRNLIRELFDFEYRWEVYKPAAVRKYGYYVLPVLCGDRLVARFEPLKHRAGAPLTIRDWWWEPGVTVTEEMREQVRLSLERFATYLGAEWDGDGSRL